ncbi:hypothetical protein IEQ34_022230 [Dendrobium chrysotoxum]|uniref:Glycosyltransferase n=1 Tax=Dendrobium chrysotoxum TaxID=161865 RepID=A0AAV7FYH6_DENCH|nr:hypothetical protein IEQ34_022230 [Dendrobium chrysotoxum]
MSSGETKLSQVLLIPSSGMGHLNPFVRLANALSDRSISISLLTVRPTITAAESRLLSSLPSSLLIDFPLAPFDPSLFPESSDPVTLRWEAIRRSAHLLPSLVSTLSPPVSSIIIDITIASTFLPVSVASNIPCFVFFISFASMLALCSVSPFVPHPICTDVKIAGGVLNIPYSSIPPPLRDPNHLFATQFIENGRALTLANGVIVNTFLALEPELLAAFNAGEVVPGFPPVIALGPLPLEKKLPSSPSPALRWLDEQPEKSVIYVNFGSRSAMSIEQIRELGAGLEMSGCRFFWVVKTAKVDREERAVQIEELLGEGYVKRVEERGLVVREWVEQDFILVHRAVAGFLSHCGLNSVMEAAAAGLRILAWPRGGDQRVIAASVPSSGLGIWPENWAWEAEERVVAAEEIAVKVREFMADEKLAETAAKLGAAATAAVQEGGSSDQSWRYLITKL